jgi:hypothetical protein
VLVEGQRRHGFGGQQQSERELLFVCEEGGREHVIVFKRVQEAVQEHYKRWCVLVTTHHVFSAYGINPA